MNNTRMQLNHASTTITGTLLQLDYLSELVKQLNMTEKQRMTIYEQIHNIKVNNRGALSELASIKTIPLVGDAI